MNHFKETVVFKIRSENKYYTTISILKKKIFIVINRQLSLEWYFTISKVNSSCLMPCFKMCMYIIMDKVAYITLYEDDFLSKKNTKELNR